MESTTTFRFRGLAIATHLGVLVGLVLLPAIAQAQGFRGGGRGGMGQRPGVAGGGIFRGGSSGPGAASGFGGRQVFPSQPGSSSFVQQGFQTVPGQGGFQQPRVYSSQPVQPFRPANPIRNLRQGSVDAVPTNRMGHTTLRPALPQNLMGIGSRPRVNAVPGPAVGGQTLLGRNQGLQPTGGGLASGPGSLLNQLPGTNRLPGLPGTGGLAHRPGKRAIPSNSHWGTGRSSDLTSTTRQLPPRSGIIPPVLTTPVHPTSPVGPVAGGSPGGVSPGGGGKPGQGLPGQGGGKGKGGGYHGNAWCGILPWLPIPGPVFNPVVVVGVPTEPILVPAPVMVEPEPTVVEAAVPAADTVANPQPPASRLVLANPATTASPISYQLDSSPFTMDAGASQELTGKPSWLIEFERGGENGRARYTLTDGAYHFAMTERGWELYADTAPATPTEPPVLAQKDAATPTSTSPNVPESAASTGLNTRVVLTNPKETGGPVNFLIDDQVLTVEPDSSKELAGKESWVIEFDRGENFGPARYTLTDGSYAFRVDEKGWDLQGAAFNVTLDNSANSADFNYLDGERVESVPAGKTRALTGRFPIVVQFDRGDGATIISRALKDGETYRVGWDEKAKALDLVAASDPGQGRPEEKSAGETRPETLTQGEKRPEGK